jgi:hypothetical protein
MDWIIYYDDGSTFTSEQGGPGDAPGLGVICVAFADDALGRAVINGWDFYIWHEPGGWEAHNYHGLIDQLTAKRPATARHVLQGRMIPRREFDILVHRARTEDSGLPVRTARRAGEDANDAPDPTKDPGAR